LVRGGGGGEKAKKRLKKTGRKEDENPPLKEGALLGQGRIRTGPFPFSNERKEKGKKGGGRGAGKKL